MKNAAKSLLSLIWVAMILASCSGGGDDSGTVSDPLEGSGPSASPDSAGLVTEDIEATPTEAKQLSPEGAEFLGSIAGVYRSTDIQGTNRELDIQKDASTGDYIVRIFIAPDVGLWLEAKVAGLTVITNSFVLDLIDHDRNRSLTAILYGFTDTGDFGLEFPDTGAWPDSDRVFVDEYGYFGHFAK